MELEDLHSMASDFIAFARSRLPEIPRAILDTEDLFSKKNKEWDRDSDGNYLGTTGQWFYIIHNFQPMPFEQSLEQVLSGFYAKVEKILGDTYTLGQISPALTYRKQSVKDAIIKKMNEYHFSGTNNLPDLSPLPRGKTNLKTIPTKMK